MIENTGEVRRIITIADAFQEIPTDKIDKFLEDLGAAMRSFNALRSCLDALAAEKLDLDIRHGFVWIDDGQSDVQINLYTEPSHEG